jgi:hypothetical protein
MSLPTTDATFAQVRAVAQTYIEYPFIELGDNSTKVYHMVCQQNRLDYNAAQIALDTTMSNASNAGVISLPFNADSNAYFVGDFDHAPIDGGLVEFERVFANIPSSRASEFAGTQSYSYAGIGLFNVSNATEHTRTITSVSNDPTLRYNILTVSNTASIGDVVWVTINLSAGGSISDWRTVLSGSNSTTIKIAKITTLSASGGTVKELFYSPRGVVSQQTGSIADFSYYLPGVTPGISNPTDVKEDMAFSILDSETYRSTDTLSDDTIPTVSEYQELIDADDYLLVSSNVTRWKGNILQKANYKVRAL